MRSTTLTGMLSQQSILALRLSGGHYGKYAAMNARGYAATAKRAKEATVSGLDTDLWKSYNAGLRNFIFKGNKLNPKTQAFYTAPMGTMGIPAGANIPVPITNMGVYQVADTLLDIDSPVFTPGGSGGSYIDRQSRYLNSIQLKKNTNAGAQLRHQSAQKRQADLQTKFAELEQKAQTAFDEDNNKPEKMAFRTWVSSKYPSYDSLRNELQQAASATAAAAIEVYGPGAKELQRKISFIDNAQDQQYARPGNNMQVSDQQADVIEGGALDPDAPIQYRPLYSIQKGYTDAVKQWIANSDPTSGTAKPVTINMNLNNRSKESWEESGFSKTSASIAARYWFVTAVTRVNDVQTEEHLSVEQLGSDLSVNLRATGIGAFDVKAGSWDGDFGNLFKDVSLLANFSLPQACAVSQIIVGYNVSLEISMSAEAAKKVRDLHSRATSGGGAMSIFGIPIGIGADRQSSNSTSYNLNTNSSSANSITIAGDDSGNPVVLGVVGRKLPKLGK